MDTKDVVKQSGSNVLLFGSAAAGLAVGSLGMRSIPNIAALPPLANKILPGLAGMAVATVVGLKVKNQYLKNVALGLGLAGIVDVLNKTIGDKIPAAFKLPALSGYDAGAYSPDYYTRSVNGLGETAYALGETAPVVPLGNLLTM